MNDLIKGAWRYRHFIVAAIGMDFRARVARSRLGFFWILISPLIQVAIFSLVLSSIMSQRLPGIDNRFSYSIYLMAGFLAWFPFVEIVTRCVTIFIDNANPMKKIAFPRIVLPIVCFGTAAINNVVFAAVVIVAYLLMGHNPGFTLLWYPVLFALVSLLALSLGLILGVLNVFIRDVQQVVGLLLQLGFWLVPIVYMIDIIPESYRGLLQLNPMVWAVDSYHRVFAYGLSPEPRALIGLAVLVAALSALALFLFRKASAEMVDAL